MTNPVYAMDTYFSNSIGTYPLRARCEMTAELGFDGAYLTLFGDREWDWLPSFAAEARRVGLAPAAVYAMADPARADNDDQRRRLASIFDHLPSGSDLELAVHVGDSSLAPSDPAGDDQAMCLIEPLLEFAERADCHICLYPHATFWLERVEDAVRLCRALDHPRLRAVFCGFHWYAVDGKGLPARIAEATPYLRAVNLCGSRPGGPILDRTIEPLDSGEMDNFALLGLLRRQDFAGRIGFQGYGIGGDAYANLRRSMAAYRDMRDRLKHHPEWAELEG